MQRKYCNELYMVSVTHIANQTFKQHESKQESKYKVPLTTPFIVRTIGILVWQKQALYRNSITIEDYHCYLLVIALRIMKNLLFGRYNFSQNF